MSSFFTPAAVVAALLSFTSTATAATLVNGSFEADPLVSSQGANGGKHGRGRDFSQMPTSGTSWGIWTSGVPGWTSSAQGIEFQTERTLNLKPDDGDYYIELDTRRNSWIQQDVMLGVGLYELSFAFSPRTNKIADNGIAFSIAGLSDEVNGPTVEFPRGEWTDVIRSFEVTQAGSYSLYFSAEGTSNSLGGFIDDIAISAVPLPAGLVLMGTAFAGLGMMRRKRIK